MSEVDIFREVQVSYKEKNFKKLKEIIKNLNVDDPVHNDLKAIVLSNCLLNVNGQDENGKTIAGIQNDYKEVSIEIINHGIDLNKTILVNDLNYSIPYLVLMSGDVDLFDCLIKKGLNINTIDRGANYLFHSLVLCHNDLSHYLIDNNIDIMPFKDHPSVINIAIVNYKKINTKEIVVKMLDKGYNFDFEYATVESPIILALNFDLDLARIILRSNYKFSINGGSNTPFETYSYISELIPVELFQEIVDKIKLDIPDVNYGIIKSIPALHILVGKRKCEQLEILLKAGLDINRRVIVDKNIDYSEYNISGMTPLVYAVSAGFEDVVELLVKYNADTNIRDLLGNHVLCISKNANRETFLKLLMSKNISLSENMLRSSTEYMSPIHSLVQIFSKESVEILEYILSNRKEELDNYLNKKTIFPNSILTDGFTPLMLACSVKNKEMIIKLTDDDRVNINDKNEQGINAISELFSEHENYFELYQINSNEETMKAIKAETSDYNEKEINSITNNYSKINNDEKLLIAKKMIDRGAIVDFKIQGIRFYKTLNGDPRKFIEGFTNKDKKSFFDKILGK